MMNYSLRLKKLRNELEASVCEAFLIEHPTHILYLTGIELSTGKILVSSRHAFLIVDGRYTEIASRQDLYTVQSLNENILKELLIDHRISQLGFDPQYTSYKDFLLLSTLASDLASRMHPLTLHPVQSLVQNLRLIKDAEEIAYLRAAAGLGYAGYLHVASLLREGITEKELAFELEFFWKKRGGSRLAFDPIIAFGANSSMPHYRAGTSSLSADTHVLIDIGVVLSHYHSDMTRTVFYGTPLPIIQEIYSIVEEAKERALAVCRPGTLIGDIDRTAREWIAGKGYKDFFTHSTGHGIGLDIHESPIIRQTGLDAMSPLREGMVITIEPGIYLKGIGGVRLEDTIVITKKGFENLTVEPDPYPQENGV